ncbi:MAG TPA: 1-(5-phosphoribosyl)-5-[(5-phosphoribosylamino)methylideneamino]imidazole-4-carboxamide isomerase [Candidatus Acidoferrales bacterium]|nr:1-(5-phosphoribosyl)-5-[(5-phosphoribosylamino)methylideneamino]imidazole-4-carboxamide isomerase [Candidatus Acidoferrales bacterium]
MKLELPDSFVMLIIPAIDIKDGHCVRLFQGEMDKETIYFESPLAAAKHWVAEGASFIHIVDLNGAVQGRPVHTREVETICRETNLTVELGGGLRSVEAVKAALDLGVDRVVIGTAAYTNAELLRALCAKFPQKIIVGIDARDGKVAVKGWKETTAMAAIELAQRCAADGASRIIYTDISRDGTREGVNIGETLKLARAVTIPVIASGGVATLEDLRRLLPLEKDGVEGVIVGRALYAGAFRLKEATAAASEPEIS